MRTETIVWTVCPNGVAPNAHVNLSVFVTPQLQTDEGGTLPNLSLFPDFVNWPKTVQAPNLRFQVTFQGHPPVMANANVGALFPSEWTALFGSATTPTKTGVTSYQYKDYSTTPIHSFNAAGVQQYVSNLYGTLGFANPLNPPVLSTSRGQFSGPPGNPAAVDAYGQLVSLTGCGEVGLGAELPPHVRGPLPGPVAPGVTCAAGSNAVGQAVGFHIRPPASLDPNIPPAPYEPELPIFDFHQAVSALGSYPQILRRMGLVFDLTIPLPAGLTTSTVGTFNVSVTPIWTSSFNGSLGRQTINVSLMTSCHLDKGSFRAVPVGPDYGNGMLDLADTSRFSVLDLDLDGASEQLYGMSQALQNIGKWVEPQQLDGATMAMTVPALRSTGPAIIWSGWGTMGNGFNQLATGQTAISNQVQAWVTWFLQPSPKPAAPPLPVLHAEDIIRGHAFDVYTASEPIPAWRSLLQRVGTYQIGTLKQFTLTDEGAVVPTASSALGTAATPPPDLYVHEGIAHWSGWSLAAPRPGPDIDPDDQVTPQSTNPPSTATNGAGQMTPQLTATFTPVPKSLPKLRFGSQYKYRARAVDLAGNGPLVSSLDASTATSPVTHYRYEPVASPVLAHTNILGPGEATHLLCIRNYSLPTGEIESNGRWLFAPKGSELLVEEHGMLDGFTPGAAPNPGLGPNGNQTTYQMLSGINARGIQIAPGRVDATLDSVPGVQTDPASNNAFYFPQQATPTTPWLPDPLSTGVNLFGFPGEGTGTVRLWQGGPWPNANPLLLLLTPGGSVGHTYLPSTATSASTEVVTLPQAAVLDLAISSTLTNLQTLGVLSWIEAQTTSALELDFLAFWAERGMMWMLSPYRIVRLVHAVRLPLVNPTMAEPVMSRDPGSTLANIVDAAFVVDAPSSADVDAEAVWTDPLDNPSDPNNNPDRDTVTSSGHAFKANVPDPAPIGATGRPMEVISAPTEFPILTAPGVVHNIGDTKHHTVNYTCQASSRFAEFFRVDTTMTSSSPIVITSMGLDPASVKVTFTDNSQNPPVVDELSTPEDYAVDVLDDNNATITLVSTSQYFNDTVDVSYIPNTTVTGNPFPVEILSSAPPKAPKVVRVSPAWSIEGPSVIGPAQVGLTRTGGYVRVYMERPWFTSGDGELLGVVAMAPPQPASSLPLEVSASWVTTMGLDPITVSSRDTEVPISPTSFSFTTAVPPVPYRPAYSDPPELPILENPNGPSMLIWPYEVEFDPVSNLWYADVNISISGGFLGAPPGCFVRLAVVRFQPYSIVGAEISPVTLCTFCQPVPDRFVSVTGNGTNPDFMVNVSVTGPGYYGWRPPNPESAETQSDFQNAYAPRPFSDDSDPASDQWTTSTITVEVQVQDTSSGLSGDLAWATATGFPPISLPQNFLLNNQVMWGVSDGSGTPIPLPDSLLGSTKMRLRICELDYYQFKELGTPNEIDTFYRRPFVAFIPLN